MIVHRAVDLQASPIHERVRNDHSRRSRHQLDMLDIAVGVARTMVRELLAHDQAATADLAPLPLAMIDKVVGAIMIILSRVGSSQRSDTNLDEAVSGFRGIESQRILDVIELLSRTGRRACRARHERITVVAVVSDARGYPVEPRSIELLTTVTELGDHSGPIKARASIKASRSVWHRNRRIDQSI